MHPAVNQLTIDVHEKFLKKRGYRLVAKSLRYTFSGGCVISRLRGCSKFNRDDAPQWRFQIETRILFDDLEYDPQTWPVTWLFGNGPQGRYSGGLYGVEDANKRMPKLIADDIRSLTERLLAERKVTRSAFEHRIEKIRKIKKA
jgi:hypothetical protein